MGSGHGSRLGISNLRSGTGLIYDYFYCMGRQRDRHSCTMSAVRVGRVEHLIERHYMEIQLAPERITETRLSIGEGLAMHRNEAEAEEAVQRLRIARLTNERRKLLQLHYAEAMPMDLFAEEQDRITRELESAERQLAEVTIAFDVMEKNMTRALELAEDCHAAYVDADEPTRRLFNQAFFDKLVVHKDGTVTHELAEPFKILLDPTLSRRIDGVVDAKKESRESLSDEGDQGPSNEHDPAGCRVAKSSNVMLLVGPAGLEPATGRL